MMMVSIKIVGPGLVVNRPAAVIYDALIKAGYEVELKEFDGQHQYVAKEDWPQKELEHTQQKGMKIQLDVDACPWGG
jgi:hypothetical protein